MPLVEDAGHGYDEFGANEQWVRKIHSVGSLIHRHYFRVSSHGSENIPKTGPVIVASNHSGTLPIDATMLWTDILEKVDRLPRTVTDHFVPKLPMVSTLFSRCGVVGGSRGNVQAVLRRNGLLMVFPEGVKGVGKNFKERYRLQRWSVGHAELSVRTGAKVVPAAVIGAEEQMPQIAKIPFKLFGAPYLPVTASPFPLPVHYHIYYGEALDLVEMFGDDPDNPEMIHAAAETVAKSVKALIKKGLANRSGVFQ